jgi:uncharacterized protein
MSFDPPLPLPKSASDIALLTYDQLAEHVRLSRSNVEKYQALLPLIRAELEARTPEKNFKCMKCGHAHFEPHEVRAADGPLSSLFGVEPARYRALVCQRCKFTELYQGNAHVAQQVLDFLLG